MNTSIKNKIENILLSRIEVDAEIKYDKQATPSTEDVRQSLSKELEVDKDLVVIKKIDTKYGAHIADVKAYQYFSKDEKNKLEPKVKEGEEKKEEAKPAEKKEEAKEKAEEKPAEKKEEAKEEKKEVKEEK